MKEISSEDIERICFFALLCEVSTSPKPGLVDLLNTGSHEDMDYLTFINSAISVSEFFKEAYELGVEGNTEENFNLLRTRGIFYEEEMYSATRGVNTHKGIIFSLGFTAYATGVISNSNIEFTPLNISREVSKICGNISEELEGADFTEGEIQYKKYGLKGVRGEAEEGFIKSVTIGLYNLKRCLKTLDLNDSLVEVLMYFLIVVEDSNTIKRSSLEGLEYVKIHAQRAIDLGAMHTLEGREYISNLDREFIEKNISPGGCADYLALTLYYYFLEELYDWVQRCRLFFR